MLMNDREELRGRKAGRELKFVGPSVRFSKGIFIEGLSNKILSGIIIPC